MSNRLHILRLYKEILREAQNFNSYYYRNYFTRKTKSSFRKFYGESESQSDDLIKQMESTLTMLKRQTQIANMYGETRLVVEEKVDEET